MGRKRRTYTNKKRRKRKVHKIRLFLISFLFLIALGFLALKITENGIFTVIAVNENGTTEEGEYKHFWFAQLKMNSLDTQEAYIQREDGKVVALSQGIVNLNTKSINENTLYTIDGTNDQGYTNGSYGADALYLETSMDGTQVLMQISGVKGWVSIEDVQLYLFDDSLYLSHYTVQDDMLIHTISTDFLQGVVNSLSIGSAPDFMKENTTYYSYDGNYFYTDFSQMKEDNIHQDHKNAVNDTAYFNFYQYVPHRSTTQLTSANYNSYLEEMGITQKATSYPCADNESALYDLGSTFIDVQNQTGVNASMMFAVALNESGYGKSEYALTNYNLFGHAAYDENPDSATTYTSFEDCIYQHAFEFIQNGYANPDDSRYHGSWFGNKASGINVQYASDPYWGEKAAHFYYQLDARSNNKDQKNITIHTQFVTQDILVYADKEKSSVLYTIPAGQIASFVIEKKENNWYTIASEAPVSNQAIDTTASYRNSVGYIQVKDID